MGFVAEEVAFEMIGSLREPLRRLARADRDLAEQAKRAAVSVPLNIGEGIRREGRDRTQHMRIAAGSAGELRYALKVAVALGELAEGEVAGSLALLDRLLRLLWGLTHPRGDRAATAARARGR